MRYFVVDAFTDELFRGNPAGVCIVETKISDKTMACIAFENNLPETAFVTENDGSFLLRWFTPEGEVDLCGHATLAAAYVIMNYLKKEMTDVCFKTASGEISVIRENDLYTLDLPTRRGVRTEIDRRLEKALNCRILEAYKSRDLLLILGSEEDVKKVKPDIQLLRNINSNPSFTIIVSSRGKYCDFVSRFFIPNERISEDPVTGSAHCTLIPYWSEILGKKKMSAEQLSNRGGKLICEYYGERVHIKGRAVCYSEGIINV